MLPSPPEVPDWPTSNYLLFPELWEWFGGKRFGPNDEINAETYPYFGLLDDFYYLRGIKNLGTTLKIKVFFVEKTIFI